MIFAALIALAAAAYKGYSNKRAGDANAASAKDAYRISRLNYANSVNTASVNAAQAADSTVAKTNDRLLKYRAQMGAVRVAQGAQGAAPTSAESQDREIGGIAGLDLSRLYDNFDDERANQIANMENARFGLAVTNQQTYKRADAQRSALNRDTVGGYIQAAASAASYGMAERQSVNGTR